MQRDFLRNFSRDCCDASVRRRAAALKLAIHLAEKGPGAGHDGRPLVSKGTPADLVAAHSTLTGQHLAAYVDT